MNHNNGAVSFLLGNRKGLACDKCENYQFEASQFSTDASAESHTGHVIHMQRTCETFYFDLNIAQNYFS